MPLYLKEERQRKIEENQAKEEAAQVPYMKTFLDLQNHLRFMFLKERRKALEAERKVKLQERNQKRREQVTITITTL